jgi:hypothetical protein
LKSSVSVGPGETTLTRILRAPISFAKMWLICSTAPLVATYVAYVGSIKAVVEEEKFTMEPPSCRRLAASLQVRKVPLTLTAKRESNSSSVTSASGL